MGFWRSIVQIPDTFDGYDINCLTGFANVLAEAVATSERAKALKQTIARMAELIVEKETLSQELKHRVRNSLHLVYGLLTSEVAVKQGRASIMALRSIALRVMGFAEVFDHLPGVGMSKVIRPRPNITALVGSRLPDPVMVGGGPP